MLKSIIMKDVTLERSPEPRSWKEGEPLLEAKRFRQELLSSEHIWKEPRGLGLRNQQTTIYSFTSIRYFYNFIVYKIMKHNIVLFW